jgi:hypothetical protein
MLKQLWNGPEVLVLHKEFSFQQQVSQHLVIGFRVAANFGFKKKEKSAKGIEILGLRSLCGVFLSCV